MKLISEFKYNAQNLGKSVSTWISWIWVYLCGWASEVKFLRYKLDMSAKCGREVKVLPGAYQETQKVINTCVLNAIQSGFKFVNYSHLYLEVCAMCQIWVKKNNLPQIFFHWDSNFVESNIVFNSDMGLSRCKIYPQYMNYQWMLVGMLVLCNKI